MQYINTLICLFFMISLATGQAPEDWFHQDPADGYYGVSSDKAYNELLAGKTSQTVVVAIIDSGMDAEHEDLADNMWVNADEIPGNGIDDDNNGYVDDIHGWNFIGGKDGNVNEDTYEVTRLYKKYKYKYENANRSVLSKSEQAEYDNFKKYEAAVNEEIEKATTRLQRYEDQKTTLMDAIDAVDLALGDQEISLENISSIDASGNETLGMGVKVLSSIIGEGMAISDFSEAKDIVSSELQGAVDYFQGKIDYAYNPDFNPRTVVGDNYADANERYYGNNNVEGPDALHGTHVGGIVGAVRNNGVGMNGVADNVRLMSIRTVPNGDERDKDVANAIRYAVDNGASIINMSFGKGYSWNKGVVDAAVKHAMKNDVLLVHAAGNSSQNNDISDNYPNDGFEKKGLFGPKNAKTWIEVGALNYKQGEDFPAPFSNYGKANVDLFAPGMSIYATTPDDQYAPLQGTSMASPVVAGVAAMLRSYFPSLSAKQVKEILMSTTMPLTDEVKVPGKDGVKMSFNSLSVSGGVVNAYKAVQKAQMTKGKRKKKFIQSTLIDATKA